MATVTFLLGLCGAGKSHLAREMKAETGARVFEDLLHDNAILLPGLIDALKAGNDCIVHEIALCIEENRASIIGLLSSEVADLNFRWICFERDLESANWNVTHRNDGRDIKAHHDYNQWLIQRYTYPKGAEIRRITRIVPRDGMH
jgi:hypothetical protein